ncbi:hypothetical protein [Arthrobacter flavus]|uniref:Uncharacterized protein n=1 Tax=Arthrobacter flavus TaxID=95172 RepID=A0ABW4Q7V7_9MICC
MNHALHTLVNAQLNGAQRDGSPNHVPDLELWFEDDPYSVDNSFEPLPLDLSDLPRAEVSALCDRAFQEMNEEFPRFGATEDYERLRGELDRRSKEPARKVLSDLG